MESGAAKERSVWMGASAAWLLRRQGGSELSPLSPELSIDQPDGTSSIVSNCDARSGAPPCVGRLPLGAAPAELPPLETGELPPAIGVPDETDAHPANKSGTTARPATNARMLSPERTNYTACTA